MKSTTFANTAGAMRRPVIFATIQITSSRVFFLLLLVIAALPSWGQSSPNDPYYSRQWGLQKIDIADAWRISTGSAASSNVVAVIDSGIDYNHPDLMANLWRANAPFQVTVGSRTFTCPAGTLGFDFSVASNPSVGPLVPCYPWDWSHGSHGTHVAGIIGAQGNNGTGVAGVNWNTKIMALSGVATTVGSTTDVTEVAAAIDLAVNLKQLFTTTQGAQGANVRVINISQAALVDPGSSMWSAIQRAAQNDILVVAAAGNDGTDNDSIPHYPANYNTEPNVISVAATDQSDFLSWDGVSLNSNFGAKTVDLAAPGKYVLSTINHTLILGGGSALGAAAAYSSPEAGYAYADGTSMAAPFVSGAAALLLSACDVDAVSLKGYLALFGDPIPLLQGRTVPNPLYPDQGSRLNVYKAMNRCIANVIYFWWQQQGLGGCTPFFAGQPDNTFVAHPDPAWEAANPGWSLSSINCDCVPKGQLVNYPVNVYLITSKANPADRWVGYSNPITGWSNWQWAGRYPLIDWRSK